MFFAGHMILAYILNRILIKNTDLAYSLPLIFAASILPDLDFLFHPIFAHHTITHSITFWAIFYIPIFVLKRWAAVPYIIATFSHFLLGDIITGTPTLFYGVSDQIFGAFRPWFVMYFGGNSYGTLYQAIVDAMMVGLFLGVTLLKRDLHPLFSGFYNIKHILLLGMIIFIVLLGAFKNQLVSDLNRHNDILYLAYGIIAISQIIFLITLLKGTNMTKPKTKNQKLSKENNI